MAEELPRPGVEVIQRFRTTTPTIITPTLPPVVVGAAKQVVNVTQVNDAGGTELNPDAAIAVPARLQAARTAAPYAIGSGNDTDLVFSVNNGTDITVTFAGTAGLTPAQVVEQVNATLVAEGVTTATAVLTSVSGANDSWALQTLGVGSFQSLNIADSGSDAAVLAAFGWAAGYTVAGVDMYTQRAIELPWSFLPDPNGNMDELVVEHATIRVFLYTGYGAGLLEVLRTESFLGNGEVAALPALTGNGSVTVAGLTGKTFTLDVGGVQSTYTFGSDPADADATAALLATAFSITATASVGGVLTLTGVNGGYSDYITVVGGTAIEGLNYLNFLVGDTSGRGISVNAIDDGNGDAVTSLIHFNGHDFTAAGTSAVITAAGAPSTPAAGSTLVLTDGKGVYTVTFAGTESTVGTVNTAINNVLGPLTANQVVASASAGAVRLTNGATGAESMLSIIGGTALTALQLTGGTTVYGGHHPPVAGDALYIDGAFYGNVVKVAPGGVTDVLRVDRMVAISGAVGRYWYITAKNLTFGTAGRPTPNLVVDLAGTSRIKHSLIRDTRGVPVDASAQLYTSYRALRKDVSPAATRPALLKIDDTTQLETYLSPISPENPLGLGYYFALVNAPNIQVLGLGIDEVSADAPYGTVDAFTRAAEFLEGYDVYAVVPLTHDKNVAEVFAAHVNAMSEPTAKGERICLWNPETPTRELDTLVASGTTGDALTGTTFDTKVVNIAQLLNVNGVNPVGTIPVSAAVFLDVAEDTKSYSVSAVNGSVVTIRTSFIGTENVDGFYSTTALPLPIINGAFAIRIRGPELVTAAGTTDNVGVAEAVAATGRSMANRRVWMTFPDTAGASINGIEMLVEGFYVNAAIAGAIGQQRPQLSFTNFPLTGFTRVVGSNDSFSDKQLNMMAAGGAFIIVQDSPNAALYGRMALTTDMTSIETRTDSVVKVVDFAAKLYRKSLRNFIGRYNITTAFLDAVATAVQGISGFLVEAGVLLGATPNNIIQDANNRDAVLLDITIDPPIPCNYIRLTLVI
jgi:hypothetical protein